MDDLSQNHISPIFYDLFIHKYLPRSGLKLIEHDFFPTNGFKVSPPLYAWIFRILARLIPGKTLIGDVHVFVLKPIDP